MTDMTLTDRYLDAAMRSVPTKQRADLAAELRASIADQIDARIEQGEPAQTVERTVLTELGDPDRLAAGYLDRPLHLIGPRFYLEWWNLLKLLLLIVPPIAAFGVAFGQTLSGESFGTIAGSVLSVTLAVVVHLCFWVTLVFALVERSAGRRELGPIVPWSLDLLPEKRQTGAQLSDMIASLVFLGLTAGLIVWDQLVGWPVGGGESMPFLDPGLWPGWIAGLFAVMAVEAILAIVVFTRGRWTMGLAVVNALLNVVIVMPMLWLMSRDQLVNPAFFPALIPEDGAEVGTVVSVLFGFVVVLVAIADSIDAFLKAVRAR